MSKFPNGGRLPGVNRCATLKSAIDWIAETEVDTDPEALAHLPTVLLVADVWGRYPEYIAERVLSRRGKRCP